MIPMSPEKSVLDDIYKPLTQLWMVSLLILADHPLTHAVLDPEEPPILARLS